MNLKKVRVGVVGTGKMGEYHLRKFLEIPAAELVGFFEPDSMRRRSIEAQYGVASFSSVSELFFEVDAVSIVCPTAMHYSMAQGALNAGVHVLVEKPFTGNELEATELVGLSERKDLILQVGLIERFHCLALCREKKLDRVRYVETNRLASALPREKEIDVVSDLLIHDLDLVLSLFGSEPTYISAVGVPVVTSHFDLANARLEFADGSVANLNVSRVSASPVRKLRVFTAEQYISMDLISNEIKCCRPGKNGQIEREDNVVSGIDALKDQCEHFIDCVIHKKQPSVTGVDGLRALKTISAIKKDITRRVLLGDEKSVLGHAFQRESLQGNNPVFI